jgi:hypothetical protein
VTCAAPLGSRDAVWLPARINLSHTEESMSRTVEVDATISGSFRRTSVSVEAQHVPLTRQGDGSFAGSAEVRLDRNDVHVALTVIGEPGSTFQMDLSIDGQSFSGNGTLKNDVALRGFIFQLRDNPEEEA